MPPANTNKSQEAALSYMMGFQQHHQEEEDHAPEISLRSIDSVNSSMRSTEFEECVRRFFLSQESVRSLNDMKEQGLTEIGMPGPVEFLHVPVQQQGQDQDHHHFMLDSQDSFQHGMLDMMRMMSIDSTLPPFQQQEAQSEPKIHPLPEQNTTTMEIGQSHDHLVGATRMQSVGGLESIGWSVRSDMSIDFSVSPENCFGSVPLGESSEAPKVPEAPYKDVDVLCGRGGNASNHPGNQAYLKKKESMQAQYMAAKNDQEKTQLSRELMDYVHKRGGRFVKRDPKDNQRWVEISYKDARVKCSQALRDDNTSPKKAKLRAETDFD